MEPTLSDVVLSFALAMWPVWLVLLAVWSVYLFGGGADTYEEPPSPRPNSKWMTEVERKYHGDDSFGR